MKRWTTLISAGVTRRGARLVVVVVLALLAVAGSARAQTVDEDALAIERSFLSLERHALENGVLVVLDPRAGASTVVVEVCVAVGTRDDPPGRTGLAHLGEHVLFPEGQGGRHHIASLQALGGVEANGVTLPDRTQYFVRVAPGALDAVLWHEARRFRDTLVHLDAEGLAHHREVVREEQRLRRLSALRLASRWDLLDPEGPYTNDEGLDEDLDRIDLDVMRAFLAEAYVPSRMTVVISGRFEAARALQTLEATFGTLRAATAAGGRPSWTFAPFARERRFELDRPQASGRVTLAWRTPVYGAPGDAELDLAAMAMTRMLAERLLRGGLALTAEARQSSRALTSLFILDVALAPGATPAAALAEIDAILAELRAVPPSLEALEADRRARLHDLAVTLDDPLPRARLLGHSMAAGERIGLSYDPRADVARYAAITPSSLHESLQRWLDPARRVIAVTPPRRPR